MVGAVGARKAFVFVVNICEGCRWLWCRLDLVSVYSKTQVNFHIAISVKVEPKVGPKHKARIYT